MDFAYRIFWSRCVIICETKGGSRSRHCCDFSTATQQQTLSIARQVNSSIPRVNSTSVVIGWGRREQDQPAGLRDLRGTRAKGSHGPQPAHGRGAQDQGHHGAGVLSVEGLQGHGAYVQTRVWWCCPHPTPCVVWSWNSAFRCLRRNGSFYRPRLQHILGESVNFLGYVLAAAILPVMSARCVPWCGA